MVAGLIAIAMPCGAVQKKTHPGRFHVGPFWLTPTVQLRSIGKNSNVYNAPFDEIADAAAVLTPKLEVVLPVGKRSRFTSEGFLNLNWFHEQASERSTDRAFRVRGEVDVSRVTIFGETGRGWYEQRFTIDLDQRVPYREKQASAGALVRLGTKFEATASIEAARFDIDGLGEVVGISRALDRDTRTLSLEGRYHLTSRTNLLVTQDWVQDSFDQPVGDASADVDSRRTLAGFEFDSPALAGRFLAGVRNYPAEDSAAPSYSGPAVQAKLVFPLGERARLNLASEREVYYAARPGLLPDGSLGRNSYVSWRSLFELGVELPFDLLARGLLGYEAATYQLPTATGGTIADAANHRWTYGATLLRAIGRGFKLGGGITWEERSGQGPTPPYHGYTWGLQAEYTP